VRKSDVHGLYRSIAKLAVATSGSPARRANFALPASLIQNNLNQCDKIGIHGQIMNAASLDQGSN
jgi:uridylate kinase